MSECEYSFSIVVFGRTWCKSLKQKKNEVEDDYGFEKERSSNLEVKFFSFLTFWYIVSAIIIIIITLVFITCHFLQWANSLLQSYGYKLQKHCYKTLVQNIVTVS